MFFFSSRRRHTRSKRDWSSDVCSSDLRLSAAAGRRMFLLFYMNQGQTSSTDANIYKINTKCGPCGRGKEQQMIFGIGCDLCAISRMEKSLSGPHGAAFARRVFGPAERAARSEEHTSELQSRF